jgi:hypothetical protein
MAFDLISALPLAVAWAEAQSRHVAETGQPLNAADRSIAMQVGVQHPELIRMIIVDALPQPDDPALRRAALATGLLGPGGIGLTLGYSIFILRGHMSHRLFSHECRHVQQYEAAGSIAAFLPVYLEQITVLGYLDSPLERDARVHEIEGFE